MKKKFALHFFALLSLVGCSSGDDNPTDDDPVGIDRSQNLLAAGDSANDLLSNANFDRILVEAAYVTGFRPTPQTMANFTGFLRQRTFKQNIDVRYLELPSPEEENLTLQEIADLERENRTAYNDGTTLAVYIYFADAPSEGDDEGEGLVTLGAVYRNTSMIIYESTIRTLVSRSRNPSITTTDVETATLNHEFGHLFGLVNLGTIPVNDHEDTTIDDEGNEIGNNHCNIEGCLMRAELQFGAMVRRAIAAKSELRSACSLSGLSIMNMLESRAARNMSVIPELDAECILDLQNNGGR